METFTWIGIAFCISQSALFSGLNLAYFSIPKLRLEIEAKNKNKQAIRVLAAREDSNFLLTTILWGNVGINVLLTLLTDSVLHGVMGFLFSTFAITILGEILPQAYFSRNALAMGYYLTPILRLYQVLLFPVAKTSAMVLDRLLGHESIHYYREKSLRELIMKHMDSEEAADIDIVEGTGAINFLHIDDIHLRSEGEPIVPDSILPLALFGEGQNFRGFRIAKDDPLVQKVQASGEKWVILVGTNDQPAFALDSDGFLRALLFSDQPVAPRPFCHKPIISTNPEELLGNLMESLEFEPEYEGDNVIDKDVILLWAPDQKRIITGADILGQLMRGISSQKKPARPDSKGGSLP